MATQEQLNTVRKLHEQNDRTLGGYTAGQYNVTNGTLGGGDPYEAYYAKMAGGLLTPDATVDTVIVTGNATPTVAEIEGAIQYTGTVSFLNDVGGEDDSVTYSIVNLGGGNVDTYSIGTETGVAGSVTTATAGDTFDVQAISNFDGTTIGILSVTILA